MPTQPADTRTAAETLAALRLKMLRYEAGFTARADRFATEGDREMEQLIRAQLDIVRDVFDQIGR